MKAAKLSYCYRLIGQFSYLAVDSLAVDQGSSFGTLWLQLASSVSAQWRTQTR